MRRAWLVGLAVGALLVVGCGGRDSGGGDAGAGGDGAASGDAAGHQDGSAPQDGGGGQQDGGGGQQDSGVQQDSGGSGCAAHQTPPASLKPSMAGRANCKGCHFNFTVAGTLYNALTGGSTVGGATVRIKNPSTGAVLVELVTDSAGLYYTTQAVAFPANVEISSCPDLVTMTNATTGNCYSSGCHSASRQVHLP